MAKRGRPKGSKNKKKEEVITASVAVIEKPAEKMDLSIFDRVDSGDVNSLRKRVVELREKVAENYIELGGILFRIKAESAFEKWGFERFEDYLKEEVTFQRRKVYYLMNVYENLHLKYGLKTEDLSDIGWTKAALIASSADTKREASKMVTRAKKKSVPELQDYIDELKSDDEDGSDDDGSVKTKKKAKVKRSTIAFRLNDEQADILNQAIEQAIKTAEADPAEVSREQALEWICADFIAGNIDPEKKLDSYIGLLEKTYGVEISYEAKEDEEEVKEDEAEEDEDIEDLDEEEEEDEDDED